MRSPSNITKQSYYRRQRTSRRRGNVEKLMLRDRKFIFIGYDNASLDALSNVTQQPCHCLLPSFHAVRLCRRRFRSEIRVPGSTTSCEAANVIIRSSTVSCPAIRIAEHGSACQQRSLKARKRFLLLSARSPIEIGADVMREAVLGAGGFISLRKCFP